MVSVAKLYTPDPSTVRPPESVREVERLGTLHEWSKAEVEAARRAYLRCKIDLANLERVQEHHRDLSRRFIAAKNAYPDQNAA